MKNRRSNTADFDKKEGNRDPNDEAAKTFSSGSKDHKPQQELEDNNISLDIAASTTHRKPIVVEKVKGDAISNTSRLDDDNHRLGDNKSSLSESRDLVPEDLVRLGVITS